MIKIFSSDKCIKIVRNIYLLDITNKIAIIILCIVLLLSLKVHSRCLILIEVISLIALIITQGISKEHCWGVWMIFKVYLGGLYPVPVLCFMVLFLWFSQITQCNKLSVTQPFCHCFCFRAFDLALRLLNHKPI